MRALKSGNGFTLVEFMISALVFVPLIGAIVMLFGTGVDYYGAVQRASQMNNEARNAVEIMSLEIAQAGTRRDITTTSTQDITLSVLPQNVQVASNKGFSVGDQVIVDAGALAETVQLTEVRTNSIGGLFLKSHASGTSVCFFAIPYLTGIVPPATLLPNSSVTSTVLRSYGDFYDNGV